MDVQVAISSADPDLRVVGIMGEGVPTLSGGDGGWVEVERPQRKAMTEWTGQSALRLDFNLLLDGHMADVSVEPEIAALTRLSRSVSDFERPALVSLAGDAFPPEALDVDWVIGSLAWGDAIRDDDGIRTRQYAVVTMLEYVEADVLFVKKTVVTGQIKPPAWRLYTVRKGDTLPKIAARLYKKSTRWREIERLNPGKLRGPTIPRKLIGKKIRVPRR